MATQAQSFKLLAFTSVGMVAAAALAGAAPAASVDPHSPETLANRALDPGRSAAWSVSVPRLGAPIVPQGAAQGGAPAYGFERDIDYVTKLATRGYREAAVWVVARLKATPGMNEEAKAKVSYAEASILVADFETERDFAKANEAHAKAKAAIAAFLALGPKGQAADEANYISGDLDRKLGEKITQELQRESGAEKVAELRKQGEKVFQDAIKYFQDRIDKVKAATGEKANGSNEVLQAEFAVADVYLSFAKLYPDKDPLREQRLKLAAERFAEFTNEVDEGKIAWYTANIKAGNAYRDLGEVGKAADFYDQSLNLLYDQDPDGNKFVRDDLADAEKAMVLDALVESARLKTLLKRQEEFVEPDKVADVRKAIPDADKFERGGDYFAELAKAYEATGKKDKAIESAKKAQQIAVFDSGAARTAQEILDRMGISSAAREMTEQIVVGPVVGLYKEGKYAEAARSYERAAVLIRNTPSEAKFMPKLMIVAGYVYQDLGRPLEASLLWADIPVRYPQFKEGASATLSSIKALCAYWKSVKSDWIDAAVRDLVDRIPESSAESSDAQGAYISALQAIGKRNAMEVATLQEEALKSVQKTDAKFGKKAFDAARMFINAKGGAIGVKDAEKRRQIIEGSRSGAERCFTAFLEWADAQKALDPDELAKTDDRTAQALLSLANMWLWEPGAQPEKSLGLLQQLDDRTSKSNAAKAKRWDLEEARVRAHVKAGKLDQAVTIVDGMATKAGENKKTLDALKFVAGECYAGALAKGVAPERATQLVDTGLRLFKTWISNGERQAGVIDDKEYELAASRMFRLSLMKNSVDLSKGYTQFWDYRDAKLPFKEGIEAVADYYGKAITVGEAAGGSYDGSFTRFRRGQALGLLGRYADLAKDYEKMISDFDLLEKTEAGYKIKEAGLKAAAQVVRPMQVLNERAYALARIAEKGDKNAGAEARKIAMAVEVYTDPGTKDPTFEFWFSRYISALASFNNADQKDCKTLIERFKQTDKELDKGKWSFDKLINDLYEKVK